MSGRTISFRIMPFNFQEFCEFEKSEGQEHTLDEYMQEYLTWGGFPLVCKETDADSKTVILSDIFDSVVLKDIVMRNKVASPIALEKVLEYLIANSSTTISGNGIAVSLSDAGQPISSPMVYDYLRFITDACVCDKVARYDIRGKKVLSFEEKTYVCDLGFFQIKPERLEAYFQKARYYYEEREYETGIAYIEETILPEEGFYGQEMMADIYFILGNCRFELEQYEDAIIAYRTAIKMEDARPEFYRDYVISLVRNNEVDKAEEALKEAEEKGISSIDLLLANGELKKGDYEGAEKDLQQCISDTEDDYIRMQSYVICDMVYREQDGALRTSEDGNDNLEYLLKYQSLLEKARTEVGLENRLLIYERLAQTYIDLQELTADAGYGESAVAVLQEVIDQGWGTYLTYNNIVILYQKMGQLEKAQAMLDQMLEMDSENYNTYKRMAFLEVEKQNQEENANRQYANFVQYYEKAKDLCADTPQGSQDVEMQLLDSLYNQLEEGGWLK